MTVEVTRARGHPASRSVAFQNFQRREMCGAPRSGQWGWSTCAASRVHIPDVLSATLKSRLLPESNSQLTVEITGRKCRLRKTKKRKALENLRRGWCNNGPILLRQHHHLSHHAQIVMQYAFVVVRTRLREGDSEARRVERYGVVWV